jgi:CheY-like chemotaxis protein
MTSNLQLETRQQRLLQELARRTGRPCIDLDESTFELAPLRQLPREFAGHEGLLPLVWNGSHLWIASAHPDEAAEQGLELELATGLEVRVVLALPWQLARAQRQAYDAYERYEQVWRGPQGPRELRLALVPPDGISRPPDAPAPQPPHSAPLPDAARRVAFEDLARKSGERRARRTAAGGKSTLEVIMDDLKLTLAGAQPLAPLPANRRVLLVSANSQLAATVHEVLANRGVDVVRAESVEAAQRFLSGDLGVDVVLVDIRLPSDGAAGLCSWVRGSAEHCSQKILLLGRRFRRPHVAMKARALLGVDDAMSTDSLQTQLNQRVRAMLDGPRRRPTEPKPRPPEQPRIARALLWLRKLMVRCGALRAEQRRGPWGR